jgi:diacylglycerol kinase family enzyme
MAAFSEILIIYNPNSTGNSEGNAKNLRRKLKKSLSKMYIECVPTQYAGHGEKLARDFSKKYKRPLIVSSSGDGGYNEVINGIMQANSQAISAVLPSGNANDHSRVMQDRPLYETIIKNKISKIDLLKVEIKGKTRLVRYAHSYVGLGLTPVVATELNRHTLNAFRETWLVLKTFYKYRPFKIRYQNKTYTLDSLIFTNINEMAKILTLAPINRPDDGKFEIITFPHNRKLMLIRKLFKAATTGLAKTERRNKYQFTIIKDMPMQLDGEVLKVKKGSRVNVVSVKQVLSTIV